MTVVFWSPLGSPVIQALPPKVVFTAQFLVDNILPDILAGKSSCDPLGGWFSIWTTPPSTGLY
jgi:hypothetical protein